MENNSESTIIKVTFHEPVGNKTEYFFGSLKAIYQQFTAKQIGCKLTNLYASGITLYNRKVTDKCVISKHIVRRVKQKKD